ncbi:MAG: hypothetical protein GX318_05590 [Clostridia bacterium]|nr:hypothetical protein [Clostridia bacterium]
MVYILPGVLAAVLAYLSNWMAVRFLGNVAIITVIPFFEEMYKSLIPVFLGAPLIYSHITFGVIEAAYEFVTAGKDGAAIGGMVSLISHLVFGIITWAAYYISKSLLFSVLFAALIHCLWNYIIMKAHVY